LIQFFSCIMLYSIDCSLTAHQFLYIDLVALVPLSILMALTGSFEKLTNEVPTATLFYYPVLTSVFASAMIQLAFAMFFFINVKS